MLIEVLLLECLVIQRCIDLLNVYKGCDRPARKVKLPDRSIKLINSIQTHKAVADSNDASIKHALLALARKAGT